jgi:hypothetical protein
MVGNVLIVEKDDTFNSFFFGVNVANDIDKEIIFDENNQPGIDRIRTKRSQNNFDCKPTNRHYNKAVQQN